MTNSPAPTTELDFVKKWEALRGRFGHLKRAPAHTKREDIPSRDDLIKRINNIMNAEGAMDALKGDKERYDNFLHVYGLLRRKDIDPTKYAESAQRVMEPVYVHGIPV